MDIPLQQVTFKPAVSIVHKCNISMPNPEIPPLDNLKRLYKLLTPLDTQGV